MGGMGELGRKKVKRKLTLNIESRGGAGAQIPEAQGKDERQ